MNTKDIIELENNEYMIISKITFENNIYYYLVDVRKNNNIKYCKEENGELEEIIDKDFIQKLLPIFSDQIMNEMRNYFEN